MDAFTPQQTTELLSRIGTKKAHMRFDKLFFNSFMCGPLLGFGCAVALSTEAAPWYQENAPGLIRTTGAMLFPIGLVMIVLTGADLFTSNVMFMMTAFLHRRVTLLDLGRIWVVSFFGNLAGMLVFMAIITGYGGVFQIQGYKTEIYNFATMKMLVPQWHQIFLRAVGANWLVCLAVFFSISSREVASKIIAIWFPTAAFVALGLDHVIANMYFIPIAIFYGHPDIGTGLYIWKSLIPTTLGNIIGGALFVATPYWYLYLTGEAGVEVDFNLSAITAAIQQGGGPMRKIHSKGNNNEKGGIGGETESNGNVIEGKDPACDEGDMPVTLPHSGTPITSALSNELDPEKYAKPKAQLVDEEKNAA